MNTYTLWTALGAAAGGACILWQARGSRHKTSDALTALLILAAVALAAGRLGYVLLHADYFREHISEIVSLASPGYWEHAVIAGGLCLWMLSSRLRDRITPAPLVILASLIGIGASIGCIPSGCAYGREVFWTDGWVWSLRADWPDMYSINNPRLPTQLFMAGWLALCAVIVLLVFFVMRRRRSHDLEIIVALWVVCFAAGDFVIQFLRMEPAPVIGPWRVGQWADGVMFAFGVAWLMRDKIVQHRNRT
ncbi:MAG: prolipoprotein diacylglyceryl transferase [Chloroflexi bacterium]|nr:prolipoprotein diacylglyceryl transferase [Chloroflexota bacterium]MCL5275557.1 prolipoprotein diacylglyceryl transferase [Chloroflexota bacterium]